MSWFDTFRVVGILVGAVGAFTFVIYYHTTARWTGSMMGRFLMLGGIGWASLYLSGVVSVLFPSDIARDIIRLVLIVGAGSFAWYQVFLYRRVRKEELTRRKERRGNDATTE